MSIQTGFGFKEWLGVIAEANDKFDALTSWYSSKIKEFATALLNRNTQLGGNFIKKPEDLTAIQALANRGIDEVYDKVQDKFDPSKGATVVEKGLSKIGESLHDIKNRDIPTANDIDELLKKINFGDSVKDLPYALFGKVLGTGKWAAKNQDIAQSQQLAGQKVQSLDVAGSDGGQGRAASVAARGGDILSGLVAQEDESLQAVFFKQVLKQSKECFKHLYQQTQTKLKGLSIDDVFKKPAEAAKYRDFSYAFYFSEYILDMIQTQPNLYEDIILNLMRVRPISSRVGEKAAQARQEKQEKGARFGKHQAGIGGVKKAFEVQRSSTEKRARDEIISKFEEYCYDEVVADDNLLKAIAARCLFGLVKGKTCMNPSQAVCMLPSDFRDEINEKMSLGVDMSTLDCSKPNDSASVVANAALQQKKVGMLGRVTKGDERVVKSGDDEKKVRNLLCDQKLAITGNSDDEKKHSLAEKFFRPDFPSNDFSTKVITNLFDIWIFGTIISSLDKSSKVKSCADAPSSWETVYNAGRDYDIHIHSVSESTSFDNLDIFYIVRDFVRTLGNDIS